MLPYKLSKYYCFKDIAKSLRFLVMIMIYQQTRQNAHYNLFLLYLDSLVP